MPFNTPRLSTVIILITFLSIGCQKDEDIWEHIAPIDIGVQISEHLDSIFSEQNNCLLDFEKDTLFHTIYGINDFNKVASCNEISEIDFDNYTLIVGKIMVSSISDSISSVVLTTNNCSYKIEATIDKCVECWGAIGHIYFWIIYPRLRSEFETTFSVN